MSQGDAQSIPLGGAAPSSSGANGANGAAQGYPGNGFLGELLCCGYKSKFGSWKDGMFKNPNLSLIKLLDQVPLLKRLAPKERARMAEACVEQCFEEGTVVISQGDMGSEFFLISRGECQVSKKLEDGTEQKLVQLRRGDWFGENALLCDEPRVASVTALTAMTTLKISRYQFKEMGLHQKLQFAKRRAVGGGGVREVVTKPPSSKTEDEIKFIRDALWRNDNLATMLNNLDAEKIDTLIKVAWTQEVAEGDAIIQAGDINADYFYIVKEGRFEVTDRLEEKEGQSAEQTKGLRSVSTSSQYSVHAGRSAEDGCIPAMEAGACFGELALLYLTQRTASVRAVENSTVWVIDRPNFKKVLMQKSEERLNEYAKMLDSVEILSCLADEEKKELANAFVEMQFTEGEVILQQGEPGKTFYILYDGEVRITKDGQKIRDMNKRGAFFGERALLADEPRTATVTALSSTVRVLALDHESFGMLLGPLGDLMKETKADFAKRKTLAGRQTLAMPMRKFTKIINFEDLTRLGLLGNGGFGCVELYQHKETGDAYALKSMSKGHIVKVGMQTAVVNEKNVLMIADCPYIVKLFATYNWSQSVVFVLELLPGGELYATYTRENLWGSEVHAKYYASMIVIAFEHLHSHRILYRDLKPENVVLDAMGIPKLIDMGLAKRVVGKTYTTCGTPDYFAPEVITGSGHNHAVDWWTLGIMIFEMLGGNPPFTAASPMQIFKNALAGIKRVSLPKKCQGNAGTLIKALLRKEPSERLPMRPGGVPNVKKHDWYGKYEWDKMMDLSMEPPFRPEVTDPTDLSNFNARPEDMPDQVPYVDDGSGWDLEFTLNM